MLIDKKILLLAAISFIPLQQAHAQSGQAGDQSSASTDNTGGLEEIVVTAQKRQENLKDTPIAITALTAGSLQKAGITDLSGVARSTPALNISEYPTSPSTLVTYIRGQGTGDPMVITRDGSVGIYLDGIYLARPQAAAFDLADVERVEVLRGPQGTLYGRNTTGGAVNLITKKPTGEFGIDGTVDIGNYGFHREFVNINLPIVDGKLAAKLTLLNSDIDGWVRNRAPNAGDDGFNDFNAKEQRGARLALRWRPTDALTVDYSGDYSRSRTTPTYYVAKELEGIIPGYSADPARTYRPIYMPKSKAESDGQSLVVSWEVADKITLKSLTGYRNLDFMSYQDYAETFFVPFASQDNINSKSYSQEFQAVGAAWDNQIKFAAGLYYFYEKATHYNNYDINPSPAYLGGADDQLILKDRTVDAKSTSYAAYGQVTYSPEALDGRVNLTLGGRFTHDKREAARAARLRIFTAAAATTISPLTNRRFLGAGTYLDFGTGVQSNDKSWNRFNPAVTLDLDITREIHGYAKYATAYKAGGSTEGAPDFSLTFNPESARTFEVGLKSELLDRKLRLNLAGFLSNYKDLQVDFQIDPTDLSVIQIVNAGSAKIAGLEADMSARLFNRLTLNASYAYLHQKISIDAPVGTIFDPAVNPAAPTTVGGDVSGYFRIPFTPKHNFNVNADMVLMKQGDDELSAYASYIWRGSLYASAGSGPLVAGADQYKRPGYGLLDARLTYSHVTANGKTMTISLWGKNILDKRYLADFVIGNGSILNGYTNRAEAYGTPATYGMQFGFQF